MEKERRKVTGGARKHWGSQDLKFDELDSLAADANKFFKEPLPSAEDVALSASEEEVSNSSSKVYKNEPTKKKKVQLSLDDENYKDLEAANVPLPVLDGFIAKFIHNLRVAYEDSSVWIWQYLQTLLYLHLLSYIRKKVKPAYPNVNWTVKTIEILLGDSPGSFEMFARIMSPQRLTRLYYGLNNLLESIKNKTKFSDLPEEQQLRQFKWFIGEVKQEINNEARMAQYLQLLHDVANFYRKEEISIRRKLEKIQELNHFLGESRHGIKLRRKIFDFFPLPLVARDPHVDSQFLAVGCSMRVVTDVVPSMDRLLNDREVSFTATAVASSDVSNNNITSSSSSGVGSGVRASSDIEAGGSGGSGVLLHTSQSLPEGLSGSQSSSSSGGVALAKTKSVTSSQAVANGRNNGGNGEDDRASRLKAFLNVIRLDCVPLSTGMRQFVADLMDLSVSQDSSNWLFKQRVSKIDKVVNALPADRTDLRAIVYNMFPIPITASSINSLITSLDAPKSEVAVRPSLSTATASAGEQRAINRTEAVVRNSSSDSGTHGAVAKMMVKEVKPNRVVEPSVAGSTSSEYINSGNSSSEVPKAVLRGHASMEDILFATRVNAQGLEDNDNDAAGDAAETTTVVTAGATTTLVSESGSSNSNGGSAGAASGSGLSVFTVVTAFTDAPTTGTALSESEAKDAGVSSSRKRKSQEIAAHSDPQQQQVQQQQQQPQRVKKIITGETIDITFKEASGHAMKFKVKTKIPILKAMRFYCTHSRVNFDTVNFVVNKQMLDGSEIVSSLDLSSADRVIVVVPKESDMKAAEKV